MFFSLFRKYCLLLTESPWKRVYFRAWRRSRRLSWQPPHTVMRGKSTHFLTTWHTIGHHGPASASTAAISTKVCGRPLNQQPRCRLFINPLDQRFGSQQALHRSRETALAEGLPHTCRIWGSGSQRL